MRLSKEKGILSSEEFNNRKEQVITMPPKPEKGLKEIDVRAGVNAGITAMVYMLLNMALPGIDTWLNICVMTIAAVFITEMTWKKTWASGLSRCLIIGIGVVFGLIVVFLDNLCGNNDIVVCVLLGVAAVGMLVVEKCTGKMYVQCKLGAVSMALTVFTFRGAFYANMGKTCYQYGIMFFLSTVATAVICLVVMLVWDTVKNMLLKEGSETNEH